MPNTILAITPEQRRTAVLSFADEYSAFEFGRTMEAHRLATKEWPDLNNGNMHMYNNGPVDGLTMLDVIEWDLDDLKEVCATRYMNMILVEDFIMTGNLQGIYITLDTNTDSLTRHLNYLWGHSM